MPNSNAESKVTFNLYDLTKEQFVAARRVLFANVRTQTGALLFDNIGEVLFHMANPIGYRRDHPESAEVLYRVGEITVSEEKLQAIKETLKLQVSEEITPDLNGDKSLGVILKLRQSPRSAI